MLVVIGDTLLDVDLIGSVSRLCPDAPAPVLELEQRRTRPGGAGLAATLAAADQTPVTLVTALAGDEDGETLRAALGGLAVVSGPAGADTPVKTRLLCGERSLARVDSGGRGGPDPVATDEMLDAVSGAGAVLVSDYGRGLARDERLRALLRRLCASVPVVWDPHPRGPAPVPGVRMATPNQAEAMSASGATGTGLPGAEHAAKALRENWAAASVTVTMGAGGALLDQGGIPIAVPAPEVTVTDPCGAGDRFAVTAASRLMAGDGPSDAVLAAVEQSARFLAAGGAGAVRSRLEPRSERPAGFGEPLRVAAATRARGGTVVATGGCFDLLHAGHVRTLAAARRLGDCLIVCLNSDASVRRLKGPDRPINAVQDRAELLLSLSCVDAVAVFDENTPEALLARLRPDVWVKGGDYSAESLPEAELVRGWGGRTVVVPYHPGRSTTRLATALAGAS